MGIKYCGILCWWLSIFSFVEAFGNEHRVVICGVCKNVAPFIANMRMNIETLGQLFSDYMIVIYENNSTDSTKNELKAWAASNPRLILMSETLSPDELSKDVMTFEWNGQPFRTELIAKARNKLLDVIREPSFEMYDFVVMADLDFASVWPYQEIYNTIVSGGDWDVVCANGIQGDGVYYDRYALRTNEFPLGPELIGEPWWNSLFPIHYSGNDLIPVHSAFGGLAIYKKEKLLLGSYTGSATTQLSSFYERILNSSPQTNPHMRIYLNRFGIDSYYHEAIPVIYYQEGNYFNSGGYGAPPACEHVVLHAAIKERGACNIFINPKMTLQY